MLSFSLSESVTSLWEWEEHCAASWQPQQGFTMTESAGNGAQNLYPQLLFSHTNLTGKAIAKHALSVKYIFCFVFGTCNIINRERQKI